MHVIVCVHYMIYLSYSPSSLISHYSSFRLYFSSFTVSSWTISFEIYPSVWFISLLPTLTYMQRIFHEPKKVCTLITSNIYPSMWLPSWAQTMEGNHRRKVSWISKRLLPMTIQNLTGQEMCPTFCQRQRKAYFQVSTHLSKLVHFYKNWKEPRNIVIMTMSSFKMKDISVMLN